MAPQIRSKSLREQTLDFLVHRCSSSGRKKKKNRMCGVCFGIAEWGHWCKYCYDCSVFYSVSFKFMLNTKQGMLLFYNVYAFRESTFFVIFVLYYLEFGYS